MIESNMLCFMRREDDIAIVNAGMRVKFAQDSTGGCQVQLIAV